MNASEFVTVRQAQWRELERLLDKAGRRVGSLSEPELNELGRLYRLVTSDLALAQREFPAQPVTRYLNQLVGRAHALIYRHEPLQWRRLRNFYRTGFPQLYRQLLPYTILAFLLFVLPALVAFVTVWQETSRIYTILGPDIESLVNTVEAGELWTDIAPNVRSGASGLILTNNIQVMFLTFAGGMTAGLLTTWVMISNGLSLGAIFGLLQANALAAGLLEFIVAHGVIELSVIFLAGGAGLYMADGILRPGLLSRREALVQHGAVAVQAILGSVPLLVIAGLIEGFISPSALPWWVKASVGLLSGVLLYGYWLLVGKNTKNSAY